MSEGHHPMACVCGSDYFFQSQLFQTAPDGRGSYMAGDIRFPWIHGLTCACCGLRYVVDAEPGSRKALIAVGGKEAKDLLDSKRIDFSKSFDPRQHGKSVAR